MKERILEFLRSENKSSAQFAEEIGVQPSGISHILSGRNNPSLDFVLKMLDRYKFLSIEWLLFGKGTMYKDSAGMHSLFEQTLFDQKPDEVDKGEEKPIIQAHGAATRNSLSQDALNAGESEKEREKSVERIVWFYADGSFREYFPSY